MELKAEHIHKEYGAVAILDDITLSLERGVKAGLVGPNGVGKSTLLKILAGEVEADSGTITRRKDLALGYMPQDTSLAGNEPVREYIRRVSGFARLEAEMVASETALAEYELRNGYTFYSRLETMLNGFDLATVADNQLNGLSSGQKSKVFLAGMLLSDPNVLLLDEPTNNLDLPALLWFEQFLAGTSAACLVVSHDRDFLDRLVSKIFEIDWQTRTVLTSHGSYSDYLDRKRKEAEKRLQAYEAQQEEIARLTESARVKRIQAQQGARFRGTDNDKFVRGFKRDRAGSSGKTAKALEKRIEQMDRIDRPITRDALQINLDAQQADGSKRIELQGLVVGYPGSPMRIETGSLVVAYGHRLAILGLNGVGKTALLRTIGGEIAPLEGSVRLGKALVIGNFTQEHQNLPKDKTLFEFLSQHAGLSQEFIYALSKKYGFLEAQVKMPIEHLSPGGRARLLFALFSAISANVLLLDEPTNHLDIEALDALEAMLADYEGTVILVSHDRHLLSIVRPTDTYLIEDRKLKRIADLDAYVEQAAKRAARLMRQLA